MSARPVLTKMALSELVRSRSYRIAFIVIALFLVGILHFIGVRLLLNPLVGRETPDRGLLLAATSGLVYCTVLIFTGLFLNISSTQPLVRAKASGSIESLLAAPVAARDLWFSLSVASILPGIVQVDRRARFGDSLRACVPRPAGHDAGLFLDHCQQFHSVARDVRRDRPFSSLVGLQGRATSEP